MYRLVPSLVITVSFGWEPFSPREGTMQVQITMAIAGREVQTLVREIQGTPAEREELAHVCGRGGTHGQRTGAGRLGRFGGGEASALLWEVDGQQGLVADNRAGT